MGKKSNKAPTRWSTVRATRGALVISVDGSCQNNGQDGVKIAGYAVVYGVGDPRNFSGIVTGPHSNTRGELMAVLRAVERERFNPRPLIIETDSENTVRIFRERLFSRVGNPLTNTDNKPLADRDLWEKLKELVTARRAAFDRAHVHDEKAVQLRHVPGHAGVPGNVAADKLAGAASAAALATVAVAPASGKKRERERAPWEDESDDDASAAEKAVAPDAAGAASATPADEPDLYALVKSMREGNAYDTASDGSDDEAADDGIAFW